MLTGLKTFAGATLKRRTVANKNPLPWIVFLVLPIPVAAMEFIVLMPTAFLFDSPHTAHWLTNMGDIVIDSIIIVPVAWAICLLLYILPEWGRRDIYCWIPVLAFGVHLLCIAMLWVCAIA